MVAEVMTTHGLSQRRACGLIEITRRSFRRVAGPDRNAGLRQRLRALAEERRRWGCPLLYQVVRREGWRHCCDCERSGIAEFCELPRFCRPLRGCHWRC